MLLLQIHARVNDVYTRLHHLLHPSPPTGAHEQMSDLIDGYTSKSDWFHIVLALDSGESSSSTIRSLAPLVPVMCPDSTDHSLPLFTLEHSRAPTPSPPKLDEPTPMPMSRVESSSYFIGAHDTSNDASGDTTQVRVRLVLSLLDEAPSIMSASTSKFLAWRPESAFRLIHSRIRFVGIRHGFRADAYCRKSPGRRRMGGQSLPPDRQAPRVGRVRARYKSQGQRSSTQLQHAEGQGQESVLRSSVPQDTRDREQIAPTLPRSAGARGEDVRARPGSIRQARLDRCRSSCRGGSCGHVVGFAQVNEAQALRCVVGQETRWCQTL
jgi:hypothetical protein